MTNKRNFLDLVSDEKAGTLERNQERIKQRAFLRESQQIALKVLKRLDEIGWSQRDLAKEMEVSPQQITKLVSGKENLTLETQVKLQRVLGIAILASFYEKQIHEFEQRVLTIRQQLEHITVLSVYTPQHYQATKTYKITSQLYRVPELHERAVS